MKLSHKLNLFTIALLFLVAMTSCQKANTSRKIAQESESEKLYLVLDIDWTLVTPLDHKQAQFFKGDQRLLKVGDEFYLLKEGARELLEMTFDHPEIEVSFFSGGGKVRNRTLLQSITLPNGQTALERSYQVLSKDDLTVVSNDQTLRFSERFKKDIKKVHPDLSKVLLLEDLAHFALGDGVDNTLWLGSTYFPPMPYMSWEDSLNKWQELGVEARYLPPHKEADWWARRKLFVLQAFLNETRDPEEILKMAQEVGYKKELPPKSVHSWLERAPYYERFIQRIPCGLPPFN